MEFTYEYDPNTTNVGEITYVQRGSNTVDYAYDNLDRLTLAEYSIDDSNEAFTIDDLGNRDSVTVRDGNNVNYDIDNLSNRYDSVGGNTLAYDAAGNLTTDKDGYQYEYDYENRITKIIKSGPTTVGEFAYDALGRRIKKRDSIANTNNIYYYNDNWQILCDYNDAGTPQSWFAYGNYIDEAVLMSKSFTSWLSARYYIHDHLYSPAALMGSTGSAPIERYEYDAYGNCQIMDASYNPRLSSSYGNPYYFTGRQLDFLDGGNLKIQYNRNRYYDYYTGRWLTYDPLAVRLKVALGSIDLSMMFESVSSSTARSPELPALVNLYEYARSRPTATTDAYGLWNSDVHWDDTMLWAWNQKLCFAKQIGWWCSAPDRDDWRKPGFAGAKHIMRGAWLPPSLEGLLRESPSWVRIHWIAYWHFPGSLDGRPVEPGSPRARRRVEQGLERCNLWLFSEGLHIFQDSYSHRSDTRQPPAFDKIGHSFDQYGWYWEKWDDSTANKYGVLVAKALDIPFDRLAEDYKKKLRSLTVLVSHDADGKILPVNVAYYQDVRRETNTYLERFYKECRCIKEGPYEGECSRCLNTGIFGLP